MAADNIDTLLVETASCKITEDDEDSGDYHSDRSFVDMPVEIFIHICNHLELKFVLNLQLVCKRFNTILSDDTLWKRWMNSRLNGKKYPPYKDDSDYNTLRQDCVVIDTVNNEWTQNKQIQIVAEDVHSADIDALLLKNNGTVCISGSRDRTIVIWNLKQIVTDNNLNAHSEHTLERKHLESSTKIINAHEGWIWDLATPSHNSDTFLSCSWDSTVKLWDLLSCTREIQSFKCPSAALCMTCVDENITIAGLSCSELHLFDKRCYENPVSIHRSHHRSILCVTTESPGSFIVFSLSEDRGVVVYDMRKNGFLKRVHLYEAKKRRTEIPLKMVANDHKCKNAIFIGDTAGTLHTFSMKDFKVTSVKALWNCENRINKMTGLALDSGALAACSANGSLVVMNPSDPPNPVMDYTLGDDKKFTATSLLNNSLVCGNNNQVRFWLPQSNFI